MCCHIDVPMPHVPIVPHGYVREVTERRRDAGLRPQPVSQTLAHIGGDLARSYSKSRLSTPIASRATSVLAACFELLNLIFSDGLVFDSEPHQALFLTPTS
jgi:hypothetical protein